MGKLNSRYTNYIPEPVHSGLKKIAFPVLSTRDDKRGSRFKTKKLLGAINYEDDFYYNIISLGFKEDDLSRFINKNWVMENALGYYKEKVGNRNKSLSDFRNIDKLISLEG